MSERKSSLEEEIRKGLPKPWKVFAYQTLDSTQDEARRLLKSHEAPFVVVAEEQVGGRGRLGRKWLPTEGALYMTAVFSAGGDIDGLSGLSLTVGAGLCEVFSSFGAILQLKWPNDLLSEAGDKLGGILIEVVPSDAGLRVLCGIGVNLAESPEISGASSIVGAGGRKLTIAESVTAVVSKLDPLWEVFRTKGFAPYRSLWEKRGAWIGEAVSLSGSEGKVIEGIFLGITDKGALRISTRNGEQEFVVGDLSLRRVS